MALATQGKTIKTRFNECGEVGISRTLIGIRPWHKFAVVEVGTDKPGIMAKMAQLIQPDVVLILEVAATHQNSFKNLDSTAKEKADLLTGLKQKGIAILNADDERVAAMSPTRPARTIYFGTDLRADYIASNARAGWPERLSIDLQHGDETVRVQTQLVGEHWAKSVTAALTVASTCGVSLTKAASAIGKVTPFSSRMQPVETPKGITFIRDESHGSEGSFDAMFEELKKSKATRKGLVIADHTDSKKSPKKRFTKMGKLAAEHCDFVVFFGDHSHHGHNAAVAAGMDPLRCPAIFGVEQVAQWLSSETKKGDLVFVKGRMTDHLARLVFSQVGNISCWKNSCPLRYACDICEQLKPSFNLDELIAPEVEHRNLIVAG